MKYRKALVSEGELLETKSSEKTSETREQTLHRQDMHKHII